MMGIGVSGRWLVGLGIGLLWVGLGFLGFGPTSGSRSVELPRMALGDASEKGLSAHVPTVEDDGGYVSGPALSDGREARGAQVRPLQVFRNFLDYSGILMGLMGIALALAVVGGRGRAVQ